MLLLRFLDFLIQLRDTCIRSTLLCAETVGFGLQRGVLAFAVLDAVAQTHRLCFQLRLPFTCALAQCLELSFRLLKLAALLQDDRLKPARGFLGTSGKVGQLSFHGPDILSTSLE